MLSLTYLLILEYPSDCQHLAVIVVRYRDAGVLVGGVYNLAVADVDSHMARIADQVAGLRICHTAFHRISLRAVR